MKILIIKAFIIFLISSVCGILGRLGGWDKGNRLFRIIGVPLCCCFILAFMKFHWTLILCFGLILGATSTYFKKKGTDAKWYNWLLVGLAESFAIFPYVWANHLWFGFWGRAIVLTIFLVVWDTFIGNDVEEEFGRYAAIAATLPIIFLFT